jgi:hypothetical protein
MASRSTSPDMTRRLREMRRRLWTRCMVIEIPPMMKSKAPMTMRKNIHRAGMLVGFFMFNSVHIRT